MATRKRSRSNDSDVSALYKEWDEASCPICMDHPHNAVLLICSSYEKGCRSYICDTSHRHSNCLDRFKKLKEENADSSSAPSSIPESSSAAHVALPGGSGAESSVVNANSNFEEQELTFRGNLDLGQTNMEKSEEGPNLKCPLCRGSVLGWKVIEEAREYLDEMSRSCSRESCSFVGNYRELRRHARRVHPTVRPADVDPSRQRAWRRLEHRTEYNDIVSAVRSAMPGAIVLGDYVIENGDRVSVERDRGEGRRWLSTLFFLQMISMDSGSELRGGRSRGLPRHRRANWTSSRQRYMWDENLFGLPNVEEDENDVSNMNMLGDRADDVPPSPRRRRRLTRAESDEDQQ
ncbi:hypothetical protein DH2020_001153 [Rehmannia glutinosa]|uniref:Uncharacterized protein n=1 Tax=Rehmannia glutinosa TaxID=99300 RepID=A0ABR0XYV6_REHGL